VQVPLHRRLDWVTLNFVVSVWAIIVASAFALVLVSGEIATWPNDLSPYEGRFVASFLGLLGVESLLWFFIYRDAGKEARWAAGLMGAYLGIAALIALLYNPWAPPILGYASISHLLFAAKGRSTSVIG